MLIGLTGHAGSGKDTAAKFLTDRGWTRIAFADPIREMAYKLNPIVGGCRSQRIRLAPLVDDIGWDEAKREFGNVREFLQRLGAEAGREVFGDECWIDLARERIWQTDRNEDYLNVVVTDVRFDNEAEFIRTGGPDYGIVVKVDRPGCEPVNGHVSDQGINPELIDYVLHNVGDVQFLWDGLATIVRAEWPEWQPS